MKHLRIPYIILLIHVVYSCNTNDNSTSAPPPNSETKSITVMNYNILHAKKENRPGYHWNEPDNRKERLIKLIEKYSPDILTAQEDMYKQGEYIKEKTGLRKIGVSRDAGTTGGTNGEYNAIYYSGDKFKSSSSGHFWLSETPSEVSKSWDASVQRILNWVELSDKNTGDSFFVFNTHLDHKGRVSRIKSSKLITDSIKSIVRHKPVILTGDMNTTPETEPIQEFGKEFNDARKASIEAPEGPLATFNGADGRIPTRTIDYIFVSDE